MDRTAFSEIKELLSKLAERSTDIFWIRSADYQKQIYISSAYEDTWGRSCESLYKNPSEWFDYLVSEDRERLLGLLSQRNITANVQTKYDEIYRVINPVKGIRWISDTSFPIHNEEGQIIAFAGIARDITDLKILEHEHSLQKSEKSSKNSKLKQHSQINKSYFPSFEQVVSSEFFTRLAEKSRSVFWIRSADYKQQLYLSPAYETIWGRPRQELYNTPEVWIEYLHPDDKEAFKNKLLERHSTTDSNTRYDEVFRIIRPDGQVRWIKDSGFPLHDSHGKCLGFAGIAEDITKEKQYEQTLIEAKERAEAANNAKSEFLAMISHELRIPLTGIIGMAQLLSIDCLLPGQRDQVEDIIKAGDHLLSLVNDLLDLTKLEAGKRELQIAPVDLRKLIEDMTNVLVFQAKLKGLELLVDYDSGAPSIVLSDARALRQILLNLLGNAVKFTENGYIVISVKCLEQGDQQALLEISVKDTGIGIPQDKLEMIFDRFHQVDSSYSRRYGGLGMGLTLSKTYVELMGGSLEVNSILNQGSTFTCAIPFSLQAKSRDISAWDNYKSSVRILIVDDTVRGEVLYKHIGSSLTQLCTGSEAMNILLAAQHSKEIFDIVIIDQQLESIDAMQLGYRINQQTAVTRPMLLLLMPASPITVKERAKAAGFYECLNKPVHPTEFLTQLTVSWEKWREKLKRPTKSIISTPAKWNILLVEDSPVVQRVHIRMLEKAGCKVDLAENAQQALAMSNNNYYDVIFMDIGLPDMSGVEVAKEIRKREQETGKNIPIIAITGFALEEDRVNCLAAGMNEVAVKPIKSEDLQTLLSKWGGNKQQKDLKQK